MQTAKNLLDYTLFALLWQQLQGIVNAVLALSTTGNYSDGEAAVGAILLNHLLGTGYEIGRSYQKHAGNKRGLRKSLDRMRQDWLARQHQELLGPIAAHANAAPGRRDHRKGFTF